MKFYKVMAVPSNRGKQLNERSRMQSAGIKYTRFVRGC